jgi:hypothetical protein
MDPVQNGTSSGTTALPSRALAMPAPSRSAVAITSSVAPSAPAPTSIATRSPALSTVAARRSAASSGTTGEISRPTPEWVMPCS